jgi:hypothetical protein
MADTAVADEIRKRRTADALLGNDDDDQLVQEDQLDQVDQGAQDDQGDQLAAEKEIDQEAEPSAPAEKAPNLGYKFVPVTPSAQDVPQNVPQGTFMGEQGLDVSPALTTQKIYSPPPEEGDQPYVIDQDTGQKIPRAQLATPEDLAAQPPPSAKELQQIDVTGQAPQVEPAPDKLDQVERAEFAKLPDQTPSTAFMGEEGLDVTPTPPKVQRALGYKFVPVAQAVKPAEPAAPSTTFMGEEGLDVTPTAPAVKQAIGVPPKVQPAQPITTNPDGSDLPQRVQAVGNKDPAAFIVHHTSGRGTVDGVVSTLKERGLGVQYVMDRDGNIFQTGGAGAQNILAGWGPKGTGLSNQNIVGMEIIAKDDKDVTDAQKQAFAQFIAARYPNTPLYGHGEVNPGHKEADEGQSAKAAALAYRDQLSSGQVAGTPGAAPQAQPVTKQANGLYQNEKPQDFLTGKATTFATPEDLASGADNGVGAPRLGKLDTTQVAGVAIPEEALRAKYGNNYAAWRTARVDVVDPQTGKRLRVPIVDLGPRGDMTAITDMTPTLSSYFGGDKNLMVKLVDNAGPDVNKNPQLWADEQAAIRQGFDSSTLQPGVQKIVPKLGYTFKPVDPARNTALQQGFEQASRTAIAQLPEQNQSLPALINRLNQPIKGVPDAMRQNYQQAVKDEATKYAQDYYGIQDPKAAYAKIMSSPDAGTFFGEIKDKALPYINQAVTAFNQSAVTIDQNRLDMLAKALHPEATLEGRKAFINSITSIPDEPTRAATINHLIGTLDPNNPALASLNPVDIADSASRMASPEYQQRQQAEIARQVDANTKALRPDPRLQGTAAGWWADQFAQLPKNVIEGITGPIGQSLMLSEIYQGTVERLRKDNPGMSEDELQARAAGSTMAQIVPAEVLNRLAGGKLGGLTGAIENPVQRIGLSALAHVGIGGTAGAAQQLGINVAEGKPTTQGVLQAAGAGAVQALPGVVGAVVHGRAPVTEERAPVEPEVRPQPEPSTTQPVTGAGILGPDVPDISMPWYKPGPIVTRAEERTAFSPQELASKVDELRQAGWTPSQIQQAMENLQPEPDFSRQTVHLGAEAQADLGPLITQEDVARRAYELNSERTKNGQPGTAADDYARAQAELNRTTEPVLPGTMSEAEPITSAIANRYVQERVATGELGQIDPSQGKSTEDMVQQGLQMSPTQRDALIDNFVKGKGGDLDQQGAAIRSKEALLSEQARAASRAADAEPTNPQLQAQAKAAADAVTAFHNGPIKKFKQVWSDSGRVLQREIPLDYTTLNGMKEAYLKGNNKEAPADLEPRLKRMADVVSKTTDAERVAMNNFGKEIENQTRGKTMPTDDQIRARLMQIMKDLPCPS